MPKKTRDELAEIEYAALEAAIMEMQALQNGEEAPAAEAVPAEVPVEAASEKPKRTRKPGKKAVVPNFVIQNSADKGATYESIVRKVQDAVKTQDVKSLEIYVKAEEGKAYYVVNGETSGAVELF